MAKILISVIGGHKGDEEVLRIAEEVGKIIAEGGAVLVTGGLSGVMEAASRGAKQAGGIVVGIIPGEDKKEANDHVDIVIPTGMGYSRNTLVAGSSDIVVALAGEYGTLSEIALALNGGKQVYGLGSWDIPGVTALSSLDELKEKIKNLC